MLHKVLVPSDCENRGRYCSQHRCSSCMNNLHVEGDRKLKLLSFTENKSNLNLRGTYLVQLEGLEWCYKHWRRIGIEIITQLISLTNSLRRRRRVAPPAAKSAVEALPHVTISEEMLGGDHTECVVCKDSFRTGEEAKQMPCKHIYHSDCIVPWLELHNTCPICRYKLPIDDPDYESGVRYVTQSSVGGFDAVTTAAAVISGGLQENVGSPRAMERSFPIRIPRWFRTSGEGSDGRDDGSNNSCPVCGYELPAVDPEYESWVAAFIAGGLQDNVEAPRATETSFPRQFRTSGEGNDGRDGGSNNSCPVCRHELRTNDPDYESRVHDGSDGESDSVDAAAVIAVGLHDNVGAPRAMERSFLRQFRTSGEGSDGRDGGSNNSGLVCQYRLPTDDPDYESSVRDSSVAEFDALVASCRVLQENDGAPRATEKSYLVQSPRQCSTSGEGSDGRDGGSSSSSSSENDNVGGSNSSGEAKEEDLD